jgi:hypothetical protein
LYHPHHFGSRLKYIAHKSVHGINVRSPKAGRIWQMRAMSNSTELADHLPELAEFPGHSFAKEDDIIERFGDLAIDPCWTDR